MGLTDLTVSELSEKLTKGETTSVDIAQQIIERTHAASTLNAYVNFDADGLLVQAKLADQKLAEGVRLPLLGIPIGLKDNIDAAGFPCGNGTTALHGLHPKGDATLVHQLRSAGALITGKLGLHELAFGITSNNSVTGAIRNPWDTDRIPGGSSGGSAAAVAARIIPAAIGTDTGGSVRVPASLCGIAGLRPTVGRISPDGIAPISKTRDTAGPMARSMADLTLLDSVMTGDFSHPTLNLRDVRLGVPSQYFWDNLEPGVRQVADEALDRLKSQGVSLVRVPVPDVAKLDEEVSFIVVLHEFVRDMTAYLTNKREGVDFETLISKIGSPDVRAIALPLIQGGTIPVATYEAALNTRRSLQALYKDVFSSHGLHGLVFPTTPRTAALIGEDETVELNGQRLPTFSTFIRNADPGSNAGIPGLSLPIGLVDHLPVGLSIDGPAGTDRQLLAIGAAIEAALPRMQPSPFHA